MAQARRVHFRFRSSFRSRFQNSVLQPGRQGGHAFFQGIFGEKRFPGFRRPRCARFAEESAQEDDEDRDERAEEFFCRRREGHFSLLSLFLKGVYK